MEVTRGNLVESVHDVAVAVVDARGRPIARFGNPATVTFYRSAAKPLQALPLVEDGAAAALGLEPAELALCCGSHGGEPEHVATARRILAKAGVAEDVLACGPHAPMARRAAEALARDGRPPERVHNNCSGKHAGMIALAAFHGWEPRGYHEPDHPVQRRMLAEVARWTALGPEEIGTAVDGCGVVCFAVPLSAMAASFARFAGAAAAGEGPRAVVEAMTAHPFMVAGTDRLCSELMARAGDRVFAKTGAEGVYCAGIPARGIGVALKVVDGSRRASEAALVRVLADLDVLSRSDVEALGRWAEPAVENTRGEALGVVRAGFRLEPWA